MFCKLEDKQSSSSSSSSSSSRSSHCRVIALLNINIAITKLINKHIEAKSVVAEEQKRCKTTKWI
jgi:hypothetical protein